MFEEGIMHPARVLDTFGPQDFWDFEAQSNLCLEQRGRLKAWITQLIKHSMIFFFPHGGEASCTKVTHHICFLGCKTDGENHTKVKRHAF